MALKYNLVWLKKDSQVVIPVKIGKTIESNWRGDNNLVCNHDHEKLEQRYICPKCEASAKIGEIKFRKDKDTGTIFEHKQKEEFMKQNAEKKILIDEAISEGIPFSEFFPHYIELLEGNYLEIFNNDDTQFNSILNKMREFLFLSNKVYLAKIGYYGSIMPCVIMATRNKILALPLRDKRLVKGQNLVGSEIAVGNKVLDEVLNQFVINYNIDRYYEYIDLVKNDKPVPIEVQEEEIAPQTNISWLDEGLSDLKKDQEKEKVAVAVSK